MENFEGFIWSPEGIWLDHELGVVGDCLAQERLMREKKFSLWDSLQRVDWVLSAQDSPISDSDYTESDNWDTGRRPIPPTCKGLERAEVRMVVCHPVSVETGKYGDKDIVLAVEFVVSDPYFGGSAQDVVVSGYLPIHVSGSNKVSLYRGIADSGFAHSPLSRGAVEVNWLEEGADRYSRVLVSPGGQTALAAEVDPVEVSSNMAHCAMLDLFETWKRCLVEEKARALTSGQMSF